jgi:hypothetical protein
MTHAADRLTDTLAQRVKAWTGYHGKHCYEADRLVCGWPEMHAEHRRIERRERTR